MADRRKDPKSIEGCFAALEAAAVLGARCPLNDTMGVSADLVGLLARAGRIKVEISGHNYRQVFILTGPNAGKCTAENPLGHHAWKIIDKNGSRTNGTFKATRPQPRQKPSAPRLLQPSNK